MTVQGVVCVIYALELSYNRLSAQAASNRAGSFYSIPFFPWSAKQISVIVPNRLSVGVVKSKRTTVPPHRLAVGVLARRHGRIGIAVYKVLQKLLLCCLVHLLIFSQELPLCWQVFGKRFLILLLPLNTFLIIEIDHDSPSSHFSQRLYAAILLDCLPFFTDPTAVIECWWPYPMVCSRGFQAIYCIISLIYYPCSMKYVKFQHYQSDLPSYKTLYGVNQTYNPS